MQMWKHLTGSSQTDYRGFKVSLFVISYLGLILLVYVSIDFMFVITESFIQTYNTHILVFYLFIKNQVLSILLHDFASI